ncbi:MAG: hypothetical protein FJW97_08685 [Actinobacteria bacterium]|nr:hypothetical protein [Actinomycetota bacterium]
MDVRLGDAERRVLALLGRRQVEWDARLAARVISRDGALGIFTAPPMDVLAFLALPAQVEEPLDVTVPMAALVAAAKESGDIAFASLPMTQAPFASGVSLAHLPPADGWQMPIPAVASDVLPAVDEAMAEFRARSAGLGPRGQQTVAEEIWSRTAWAGLPLRVLHAGYRLRFLSRDRMRIAAATNGPWRRLSTPRGQVFSYVAGIQAQLSLHAVS